MHVAYTQTSTKARPLKALREQKRRVVVCGLIALAAWNNGAGREWRVSEWNNVHRGVSGGNNNGSELQVVLEFPAEFYEHGTVKGARWRRGACLFQLQQRSKVRLDAASLVEERGREIGLLQPPVF